MPAADGFVGADRDEPETVRGVSKLRDLVTVSDEPALEAAVAKIKHVNVPKTSIAKISSGECAAIGAKGDCGYRGGERGQKGFSSGNGIPEFEATVMRERREACAARGEGLAVGGKLHRENRFRVRCECLKEPTGLHVPEVDGFVVACTGESFAVGTESNGVYRGCVTSQGFYFAACLNIPQFHRVV